MPGPISDTYQGPDGGADPYYEGDQQCRLGCARNQNPYEGDKELAELWLNGWDDAASDLSLSRNACWEMTIGLETNEEMRERLRNLSDQDGNDDYDRVVKMLLNDFGRLKVVIAAQIDKIQHLEEVNARWVTNFSHQKDQPN